MDQGWSEYYEATLKKPLNPFFAAFEPHLPKGGLALDLGCGVGHGTLRLLELGFEVEAIDADPQAIEITGSRLPQHSRCRLQIASFEDYLVPSHDVCLALFSLFFLPPGAYQRFWERLVTAMRPGTVFGGQLLGTKDDWRDRGYTLHDAESAHEQFQGFDVLHWEEAERDGETAIGNPKHWHVFHVVAAKK
jgi:trans-aconitate methyltransferase